MPQQSQGRHDSYHGEGAMVLVDGKLVSTSEASKILSVSPTTLRKWADQGIIPSYRIGERRDRRFAIQDLVALLSGSNRRKEESGVRTESVLLPRVIELAWLAAAAEVLSQGFLVASGRRNAGG